MTATGRPWPSTGWAPCTAALGEHERSRELLRESIAVGRRLSDRAREATALTNLALLEIDAGNPTAAIDLLAEAEAIDAERGNAWGVAADRTNRVTALLTCGRVSEACRRAA